MGNPYIALRTHHMPAAILWPRRDLHEPYSVRKPDV